MSAKGKASAPAQAEAKPKTLEEIFSAPQRDAEYKEKLAQFKAKEIKFFFEDTSVKSPKARRPPCRRSCAHQKLGDGAADIRPFPALSGSRPPPIPNLQDLNFEDKEQMWWWKNSVLARNIWYYRDR